MPTNVSRRDFLKLSGLGIAAVAAAPLEAAQAAVASRGRGYVAGKYGLELDGVQAGWLLSVEGGDATADVIEERLGNGQVVRKHIGNVKYEDITLSCGTGMSKSFYDWIKSTVSNDKQLPRNGAIIMADYDYREVSRLRFTNALMTEIGFPALDAVSKDAARLTVTLSPEVTRRTTTPGGTQLPGAVNPASQKRWLPSDFRLTIDKLEEACKRVNAIEPLIVKRQSAGNPVAGLKNYAEAPARLELPNLVITLPDADAKPFYDWHESFVINGHNGPDQEKSGMLEFLAPDLKDALFTLSFSSLGIFKIGPDKSEAGSENVRRVKVEMYVGSMKFDYGSVWA